MGYAVKIGTHAVDAVTGAEKTNGIVAAESTSISANLRKRFGSGDLRLRPGKERVIRQGNGWAVEGGSPYGSYAGTPLSGTFAGSPQPSASPSAPSFPGSPNPASATTPRTPSYGLGLGVGSPRNSYLSPHTPGSPFPTAATAGSPYSPSLAGAGLPSAPSTPSLYAHFPPTPTPGSAAAPSGSVFAQQQASGTPPAGPPPPRGASSLRHSSNGSANGSVGSAKKDD